MELERKIEVDDIPGLFMMTNLVFFIFLQTDKFQPNSNAHNRLRGLLSTPIHLPQRSDQGGSNSLAMTHTMSLLFPFHQI
jgi:hypothetical protein